MLAQRINCYVQYTLRIALPIVLLKKPYRESTKRNMPPHWFDAGLPHTHTALDDAIEQGALFCNMLAELRKK